MMFTIHSEDRDALHAIAEMVSEFYDDEDLLDACITRYAQYEFEPEFTPVTTCIPSAIVPIMGKELTSHALIPIMGKIYVRRQCCE